MGFAGEEQKSKILQWQDFFTDAKYFISNQLNRSINLPFSMGTTLGFHKVLTILLGGQCGPTVY